MKNLIRICLVLVLLLLLSFTLQAQNNYANLEPNKNVLAKGLIHKLNITKDTLILQSDQKINYLYSINKVQGKDFDCKVDNNVYRLPLNKLSLGKHVFVAVQSEAQIVFVLRILEEIPKEEQEDTIEEDVVAVEPVRIVYPNN